MGSAPRVGSYRLLAMVLPAGVLLFFLLTLVPYYFPASNQLRYLLYALHRAHPEFLAGDWFATEAANHHPFFSLLMSFPASLGNLPLTFFLIRVAQFVFLIAGILNLSRTFSKDPRTGLLVFYFLLFYFSDGLGQETLYSEIVQSSDIGKLFYLFSLGALLQGNVIRTWLFLGLTGLFDFLSGLEGFLLLLLYSVFHGRDWDGKRIGMGFLLFLLLMSPNLVPILRNFSPAEPIHSPEILKVFFNFCYPHHYRPSVFELSHSFRILFPLSFLFFLGKIPTEEEKFFHRARLYVAILLWLCLLFTISVEWVYFPFLASFRFFRLSPFLLLLGLIALSYTLLRTLDRKKPVGILLSGVTLTILFLERDSRLFVPLTFFLIIAWSLWTFRDPDEQLSRPGKTLFVAVCILIPVLLYLAIGRNEELIFNASVGFVVLLLLILSTKWRWPASQALLAILLIGIPAVSLQLVFPSRLHFHPVQITPPNPLFRNDPDLEEVVLWMRDHTEKDSRFLTPPYRDGIRFFSERAIVVDFMSPTATKDIKEWKERIETVTQTSGLEKWKPFTESTHPQREFLRRGYLDLKADRVEEIARFYQADYFLSESNYAEKNALLARGHRLVFENDSYLLFEII